MKNVSERLGRDPSTTNNKRSVLQRTRSRSLSDLDRSKYADRKPSSMRTSLMSLGGHKKGPSNPPRGAGGAVPANPPRMGRGGRKKKPVTKPPPTKTNKKNKSKWEAGVEAISEILDPACKAYQYLTSVQKTSLKGVKNLLLASTTGSPEQRKLQHVPQELLDQIKESKKEKENEDDDTVAWVDDDDGDGVNWVDDDGCVTATRRNTTTNFILQQFAGVKTKDKLPKNSPSSSPKAASDNVPALLDSSESEQPLLEEEVQGLDSSSEKNDDKIDEKKSDDGNVKKSSPTTKTTKKSTKSKKKTEKKMALSLDLSDPTFVPPEFLEMEKNQQHKLFETLQWENINSWEYDIFGLEKLANGKPMLFVGWAVLGAPYAQQAMAKQIGATASDAGYNFMKEFNIPPQKLYNFVKIIEQDYNAQNAYHNATHGSDVLQSLHTLIQASADQEFLTNASKLQIFSVLMSALCHDVAHLGTSNAYQTKIHTELAILYNDKSVMENWHVAHAFSRMIFGSDLPHTLTSTLTMNGTQADDGCDCNVLCNVTPEQFCAVRKSMIDAILHTDMTNHFEMVNSMRGMHLLWQQQQKEEEEQGDGEMDPNRIKKEDYTWRTLVYMLHLADISAQTKEMAFAGGWVDRCFIEFFAQGDQEAKLGLPISPNCDRHTVKIPDSQIGFIKFVIQPAYEVLGQYIPFVQESVLPIIDKNMAFYTGGKK